MEKGTISESRTALRLIKAADLAMMTAVFAVGYRIYYAYLLECSFRSPVCWVMIGLYAAVYLICGRVYDAFLVSMAPVSEMVYSQSLAALLADVCFYLIIWHSGKSLPRGIPMMGIFAVQILTALVWSKGASCWYYRTHPPKRSVVVYDARQQSGELIRFYGMNRKFHVERNIRVEECFRGKMEALNQAEVVFLCGLRSQDRNRVLKYCVARKIRVYVIPRIGDLLMSQSREVHLFHLPMLGIDRFRPGPGYRVAKRLFDVAACSAALVLLSPVLAGIALAVKLSDGGPVLYRQCRLTKDRREFQLLKFRSMRVDAECDGVARLSTGSSDPRVTRLGRFLRRSRMDELPQLVNILRGEMSLVGPRPERPEIAAQYEKELPEFALRLQVQAGLTGYAQVYGKYNTEPYDKLLMDLMYLSGASFRTDLRLIFATFKVLFDRIASEGVREGQVTASGPECLAEQEDL